MSCAGPQRSAASLPEGENLQTSAQGTAIVADKMLGGRAENSYDLIAVPGGLPGSEHLAEHPVPDGMLRAQAEQERLIGAICAAPALVLSSKGLLRDSRHLLSRFSTRTGGKGSGQ